MANFFCDVGKTVFAKRVRAWLFSWYKLHFFYGWHRISDSFLHLKLTCMSCQVIPEAWPSRVVRGSIKLWIPSSLASMSIFVPSQEVCFFSDFTDLCREYPWTILSGTKAVCLDSRHSIWSRGQFFWSLYLPCQRLRLCVQWSGLWHWVGVPLWRSGLPWGRCSLKRFKDQDQHSCRHSSDVESFLT